MVWPRGGAGAVSAEHCPSARSVALSVATWLGNGMPFDGDCDFLALQGRHKPAIASSKKNMSAEEVQALMASTDTDGVGLLDEEEFLRLARAAPGRRQCQLMIRRFDLNGDGVLTSDEFKTMMMMMA
ncbi:hypothetical protein CFC21_042349 [Triticum aestivum]|uniref:EF-hand domain-containing protein n=2 Tax=Triticum aestivum TaxID=4565 RepID=A0A3B6FTZ5_WHEAT|nr:hypothetical protein CFC21_042349 [Triticum aestivum]